MTDRAVVMTVSADRPVYLAETLRSWLSVRELSGWSVGFAVEPGRRAEECVELIQTWRSVLPAVESWCVVNTERRGVLSNPFRALQSAFATASFAVLVEEDVLVSTDVLEFMTTLSDRHRDDSGVLGICAFSRRDGGDVAGYGRAAFSPLVWGTWRDRWSGVIEPRWFEAARGVRPGVEEGWDWGIARIAAETGDGFLAPLQSRSQHIGEHGEHMRVSDFAASQALGFVADRPPTAYHRVDADAVVLP